jgi:predicted GTPase
MVKTELNPFIYGKPVPPKRFIGRRRAVQTLFSRLEHGESVAVVGEPNIGKSSLLRYIRDEELARSRLVGASVRSVFVDFDGHIRPLMRC